MLGVIGVEEVWSVSRWQVRESFESTDFERLVEDEVEVGSFESDDFEILSRGLYQSIECHVINSNWNVILCR